MEILREKLSPKEYEERKYQETWKKPGVHQHKGIHPEKLHNVHHPTKIEDEENKIHAGMRALEEVKRSLGALGWGKLNPDGTKKKLRKRKITLDDFESEEKKKADEYQCPFCDNPNPLDVMALRKFLSVASSEHDLHQRKKYLIHEKTEHEKDVDAYHKKYEAGAKAGGHDIHGKQSDLSDETRESMKAEEGFGQSMLMGAQRGLGHEAGNKQDSGQSAQITEVKDKIDKIKKAGELKPQKITEPNKVVDVVEEAHPKAEQINEKVREKIESMSVKSAYENHEQDESPEVKPNKQQIPASKPGMDTFKSLFKKSLVIKYNNLYKPLNT